MKKNRFKHVFSTILLLFFSTSIYCQNDVKTVQPSIIVIPYVKQGQDIRTVLEADAAKRIAISMVKDGFDQRGFTTYDFVQTLKNIETNQAMTMESQLDIQSLIIDESGADIYVSVEVSLSNSNSGNGVDIILTSYESSTARSLSSKIASSGRFYTTDNKLLVQKALSGNVITDFLNTIQLKFTDIVNNGRSVVIEFTVDQNASINLNHEIDGLPLSDFIEIWMSENAFKNNYRSSGATANRMIFEDVRIPVRDDNNLNYTPTKFALKLFIALRKEGLKIQKVVKRQNIYITVK